ncbi:ribosome-binding factor A [Candidatus Glomeribacter gigasporarum BEG34]|uniref:Ribosome-binding factor A n=1 Tax=Candidatus Glomeribacter gigasporarum BEG34 TaxID=1070319 RepID=G2JC46_9BURK|nr:30S ribosome-binding factor RbfA [Candidatus Glomeribacter gigasporarum]CCD30353.1 ribosome-binding factor A [Candidatus Glomeribacter gigasporarum BEG34]
MPKHHRPERALRIADQIQRDLSAMIMREVKDPRIGGIVTLQGVDLTPDYAHAKVWFTTLSGDPQQTCDALNHAAGHLRRLLFKRLHIHTVPTLHFISDPTPDKAAALLRLINESCSPSA